MRLHPLPLPIYHVTRVAHPLNMGGKGAEAPAGSCDRMRAENGARDSFSRLGMPSHNPGSATALSTVDRAAAPRLGSHAWSGMPSPSKGQLMPTNGDHKRSEAP